MAAGSLVPAVSTCTRSTPAGGCNAVGPEINDRRAWQAAAESPEFKSLVSQAQRLRSQPMPELTDELFLGPSHRSNAWSTKASRGCGG